MSKVPGVFKVSDHVSWRDLGETIVLMNLENGETFQLVESSAFLFRKIAEGPVARQALGFFLANEYEVSQEEAESDSSQFVDLMFQAGLVVEAG